MISRGWDRVFQRIRTHNEVLKQLDTGHPKKPLSLDPQLQQDASSTTIPSLRALQYIVDMGGVCIARTDDPNLSFPHIRSMLDDVARRVHVTMTILLSKGAVERLPFPALPASSPRERVTALAFALVHVERFVGNSDDYYNERNSFVDHVLQQKVGVRVCHSAECCSLTVFCLIRCCQAGIPISLSLLHMSVAARLGILLEPVNFPGHFLLCASTRRNRALETEFKMQSEELAPQPGSSSVFAPEMKSENPFVGLLRQRFHQVYLQGAPGHESVALDSTEDLIYADAFSGRIMEAAVLREGPVDDSLTQPCSFLAMFQRMYANIMGLYDARGDPLVVLCVAMSVHLHQLHGEISTEPVQRTQLHSNSEAQINELLEHFRLHFTQADQIALRNAYRAFRQSSSFVR